MQFIVHINCKMQISNTHTTKEDTLSEAELQQVWTKIVNYDLKKGNINREQRSAMVERDWTAVDELFEGCIISSIQVIIRIRIRVRSPCNVLQGN